MLKRLQRPENQAARLNYMAAQFGSFQTADTYLRNYSKARDLGLAEASFEQEIAEILYELQGFISNAKEGGVMTLRSSGMGNLERNKLLQVGRFLLQATDINPKQHDDSKVVDVLQQLFMPDESTEELGLIFPSIEYQAFKIMQLTTVYLAYLKSVTYNSLTKKGDPQVGQRFQEEKTFWQYNTTPQNILSRIARIQTTMEVMQTYPQVIFSKPQALEVCHFIALVSKFGRVKKNLE